MPEISRFYGLLSKYIADHDPPRFYVWYDDYKATMTITDGIITGSLPRRAIKMVYE